MENTKEEFLVQRKILDFSKIGKHLKKYRFLYGFLIMMALFMFTDFVLIGKFITLLLSL